MARPPVNPDDAAMLRIIAQDPSVRSGRKILTAVVPVPAETLSKGPWGHRIQVIDYDASRETMYAPLAYQTDEKGLPKDPFAKATDRQLLADPRFHQQNIYAIVMRTLATFERVLGRRLGWSFPAHQLKVVPHAFEDANAFYSARDNGLYFGYFPAGRQTVFTCLSHDVIVHETTHALLDGLRGRFIKPSSPDQAAFHEGFADTVALLSVFQLPEIVTRLLDAAAGRKTKRLVPRDFLSDEKFVRQVLLGLAEELGESLYRLPGRALRMSYTTKPRRDIYQSRDSVFSAEHRRGELLVAAMLDAFVRVWQKRLVPLGVGGRGPLDRERVVEEGASAASHLLTIAIRGIDYTPPVHLTFRDYLSALLTADREIQPDDSKYHYRVILRQSFARWGIRPAAGRPNQARAERQALEPGLWCPVDGRDLSYHGVHQESMRRDPDEVFRFLWENRRALHLHEEAYSQVLSVRPCRRIAPDGAPLQETVVEFKQTWEPSRAEWTRMKLDDPDDDGDRDDDEPADSGQRSLEGGGTLLFDDFGRLKYYVHNAVKNARLQRERFGYAQRSSLRRVAAGRRFAELHSLRAINEHPMAAANRW